MRDFSLKIVHGARWWEAAASVARSLGENYMAECPEMCAAVVGNLAQDGNAAWMVAFVGAITTNPPSDLVIYEWFVLNPAFPLRVRYHAACMLLELGQIHHAATGKRALLLHPPSGLRRMAERYGYGEVGRGRPSMIFKGDL